MKILLANLAVSVLLNVDQIAPGSQKDLVQKLGGFIRQELPFPGQKYQAKEDEAVGLVGIEEWYEKNICKTLFFLIPH